MDRPLPDELLSQEVDRRYRTFGPSRNPEQRERRLQAARRGLEPAWQDVHRYGPTWARQTMIWLDRSRRDLLPGSPPPTAARGYRTDDLGAVLSYLGEGLP